MNIVIIGGHDCMHCRYKQICKTHGCKCKVFTQCPANLRDQIGSPEMIIVFTKTVAHKMLKAAEKQAERTGTQIRYLNSSGAVALNDALNDYFRRS